MSRIGIIGYRSWIAEELIDRFCAQDAPANQAICIEKSDAATYDSSSFACLFLIPGKVVQTEAERAAELELVAAAVGNRRSCKRIVMLSSAAVGRTTEYGIHKDEVERVFFGAGILRRAYEGQQDLRTLAVRPGAVFGHRQSRDSTMLIPSIGREGTKIYLEWPDRPASFIHVSDLADHLISMLDPKFLPVGEIPGTFTMTPRQLVRLYEAWR